ncbi:sel1 repeat family protein [Acetobacteraceae bacterium]|nr:sel1 repeat family protein [Acetobacteraceae bacterium]
MFQITRRAVNDISARKVQRAFPAWIVTKYFLLCVAVLFLSRNAFSQETLPSISENDRQALTQSIKDHEEQIKALTPQAERGEARAEYQLADIYNTCARYYYPGGRDAELGHSPKIDYSHCNKKKAVYWYQKSAESGDKIAESRMGDLYDYSDLLKTNYEKASYWYTKAVSHKGQKDSKEDGLILSKLAAIL